MNFFSFIVSYKISKNGYSENNVTIVNKSKSRKWKLESLYKLVKLR
jgi:hypothetical protein